LFRAFNTSLPANNTLIHRYIVRTFAEIQYPCGTQAKKVAKGLTGRPVKGANQAEGVLHAKNLMTETQEKSANRSLSENSATSPGGRKNLSGNHRMILPGTNLSAGKEATVPLMLNQNQGRIVKKRVTVPVTGLTARKEATGLMIRDQSQDLIAIKRATIPVTGHYEGKEATVSMMLNQNPDHIVKKRVNIPVTGLSAGKEAIVPLMLNQNQGRIVKKRLTVPGTGLYAGKEATARMMLN
jgi:hypothetical protein